MAGRELLGSGLFFLDARYNAVGAVPWHDLRESITRDHRREPRVLRAQQHELLVLRHGEDRIG